MLPKTNDHSRSIALSHANAIIKRAQLEFACFVAYTMPEYEISWHNLLLMDRLQRLADGKIKKLMVFMPPRHGKSELVSRRFPAWMFGRNMDENVIGSSHSMSLAAKMNRDIQRIMCDTRYQAVFPNVVLGTGRQDTKQDLNYLKNTEVFEIGGHKGLYRAAGVGSGITGMGFDLGIVDDPVKDQDAALSPVQRDRVWEWFTSTFFTRAHKDAKFLITLTRWHEDDLGGKILKHIRDGDPDWMDWEVLSLPAIAEEDRAPYDPRKVGDPLWPQKFDAKALQNIKATIGSSWWASLYQQSPRVEGGNIVQRRWWKKWTRLPDRFDTMSISWDLTFKETGSSWVVGQVWGRRGIEKYLCDQVRVKAGFVESLGLVQSLAQKWPKYNKILIEAQANGPAIIDAIKQKVSGVVAVKTDSSKVARLHAVSPMIEAGEVYLPEQAPWLHDYVEEFSTFPNAADDDQVDATTQALLDFRNSQGGQLSEQFLPTRVSSKSRMEW